MIVQSGMAAIAARYDGFIVDLWGVLHDGVAPYPGAVDCLERLRAAGKRVVLLSNAPRRAAPAREALRRLGIGDHLYDGLMTSGEAAHIALRDRHEPWFAALGPRMHHLGPARDRSIFEGLPLEPCSIDGADWLLNTGPDDLHGPTVLTPFEPVLRAAIARGLKMLCANPDLEVVRDGERIPCAGALAAFYEELGGEVRSLGKPDPLIYQPVLAMLGLPRDRVLAVGDSLRTDIAGAKAASVDACWVLGGIHADIANPNAALCDANLTPTAILRQFVWCRA